MPFFSTARASRLSSSYLEHSSTCALIFSSHLPILGLFHGRINPGDIEYLIIHRSFTAPVTHGHVSINHFAPHHVWWTTRVLNESRAAGSHLSDFQLSA